MKTKIASAILFNAIATSTFAMPSIYGEIDASIDYLPEHNAIGSNKDVWELHSNSSYIGFKGEEKLTDRLSAIYLAEWSISADGDGTDWGQRNRFVGLKDTQLGVLKVGKHDTPLKQLSGVADTFNNYAANSADIQSIMTGENRLDNAVVYESPNLQVPVLDGDIQIKALLASGESKGINKSSGGVKAAGRGFGDAWSASASFSNPFLVAAVAYDKAVPSNFAGHGMLNASNPHIDGGAIFAAANTIRVVGQLKPIDGLALKALFQTSEVEDVVGNDIAAANIDDSVGWLVGAEYKLPQAQQWTVKGQYSQNSTGFKTAGTDDFDAEQIIAGIDYAVNKQVRTYGYAGYLTLKQGKEKDKQPLAGIGLEYKF